MKLALFDVAGTLTEGNTWTNLVNHPKINRWQRLRLLAWAYPAWFGTKVGLVTEIDFRERWVRGMARLLQGWTYEEVIDLFRWIVDEHTVGKFHDDVVSIAREHKSNGDYVVFVSNMFEDAVQMVADEIGADKGIGTALEYDGDICTGKLASQSCAGPEKLKMVTRHLQAQDVDIDIKTESVGYSDSWSDRYLLDGVATAHAVYPDKRLLRYAEERGWRIIGLSPNGNRLDA